MCVCLHVACVAWSVCLSVASHLQRVSLILIVCLSGCLSVIPRPTAYHDWSITTKFGRQVYTLYLSSDPCKPSWIPYLAYFSARGKICKILLISKRTWCIVPYDLSVCLLVTLVSPVNTVELNWFVVWTRVGSRNHAFDRLQMSPREGAF